MRVDPPPDRPLDGEVVEHVGGPERGGRVGLGVPVAVASRCRGAGLGGCVDGREGKKMMWLSSRRHVRVLGLFVSLIQGQIQ